MSERDAIRVLEREVGGDGGAERVGDEVGAIDLRDIERDEHARRRIDLTELARLRPEPREIEREDPVVGRERVDLTPPHPRIEGKAVEHHESRRVFAPPLAAARPLGLASEVMSHRL